MGSRRESPLQKRNRDCKTRLVVSYLQKLPVADAQEKVTESSAGVINFIREAVMGAVQTALPN